MTASRRSPTPSQTVGPFFLGCLLRSDMCSNVLVKPETTGDRIRLEGQVLDGDGRTVPDAVIEIWQADAHGRYRHPADQRSTPPPDPHFHGFGRSGTDETGLFWFETVKPGAVDNTRNSNDGSPSAPHITVLIFARGLLNHLATRVYFADEPTNGVDPTLARVPAERRDTLLAKPSEIDGRQVYRWDVILQGQAETAFFNW